MPIPGQDKDITDNEGNYPNTPNQWLLRNLFGGTQVGWSSGGSSPTSFNIAYPTVPSTSFLIPWVPGPPVGGFNPTNIFIGGGNGGNTEVFNGTNGTNGTNGAGDPISCKFYDSSSNEVIVDPVSQIFFNFPPGEVTDAGDGVVEVTYNAGSGSTGNLTATLPVVVTPGGSMSNNQVASLNYDSTDSFVLSGASSLQLKAITVTPPTDLGAVSDITVDGFGRVTAYARQLHGIYKITSSTFVSPGHWEYNVLEQTSVGSTWPFFGSGSTTLLAYNLLETANTSSVAYGLAATGTAAPIVLTNQGDYKMYPVPNNLMVEVWKWGTKYFFSAPNVIDGACP